MRKRINYKLIIGTPVLVIAVCALTVLVLVKFNPQGASSNTEATVPDPAAIVKQYQTAGTVGELDNLYTKRAESLTGMNFISYTADNSYAITVTPTDFVQFEQKDKKVVTNSALAKSDTEAFLVKQKLQKRTSASTATTPLYQVFENNKTVCQLFDMPSYSNSGSILGLSCIKKQVIDDQYTMINKLLALYNGSKSDISNPTAIQTRTTKENTNTLSVTDIYGLKTKSGAISLIFAAISDKWEYIGQRTISNGEVLVDNSISADLKTKINDPKYDGFLLKNIK